MNPENWCIVNWWIHTCIGFLCMCLVSLKDINVLMIYYGIYFLSNFCYNLIIESLRWPMIMSCCSLSCIVLNIFFSEKIRYFFGFPRKGKKGRIFKFIVPPPPPPWGFWGRKCNINVFCYTPRKRSFYPHDFGVSQSKTRTLPLRHKGGGTHL